MSTEWTNDWHKATRAVCHAAPEGPWTVETDETPDGEHLVHTIEPRGGRWPEEAWMDVDDMPEAARDFIVQARTLLPAALDEIERLHAENRRLRLALGGSWAALEASP